MVLKETTDPQEVKFIPRKYEPLTDVLVTLRDEQTNTSTTLVTSLVIDRYYVSFTEVLDLKEDRHYVMEITDNVIDPQVEDFYYIAKVFCTNQDDYSINDGQYQARQTDNEYIVIDD